jgi:Domain of unknown function (DUF1772)
VVSCRHSKQATTSAPGSNRSFGAFSLLCKADDVGISEPGPSAAARSLPLTIARVAHQQWFFVNLYEAVVRMPDRLADEHDSPARGAAGLLAAGSPARYHLPAAPILLGSTIAALADGLRNDGDRAALLVAAVCSLSGAAVTGYLVRRVNLRLLHGGPPIGPEERRALMSRWYGANRIRLALLAAGSVALERAARHRSSG